MRKLIERKDTENETRTILLCLAVIIGMVIALSLSNYFGSVTVLPATLIIDRQGNVQYRH